MLFSLFVNFNGATCLPLFSPISPLSPVNLSHLLCDLVLSNFSELK
jgi:hypothetical protein